MGLLIPGATFALWSTAGGVVAISTVTAAMLVRGVQVAFVQRRNNSVPPSSS